MITELEIIDSEQRKLRHSSRISMLGELLLSRIHTVVTLIVHNSTCTCTCHFFLLQVHQKQVRQKQLSYCAAAELGTTNTLVDSALSYETEKVRDRTVAQHCLVVSCAPVEP